MKFRKKSFMGSGTTLRAALEKEIGASCLKKDFLENLNPEEGRKQKQILPDCDGFCQTTFDDLWET